MWDTAVELRSATRQVSWHIASCYTTAAFGKCRNHFNRPSQNPMTIFIEKHARVLSCLYYFLILLWKTPLHVDIASSSCSCHPRVRFSCCCKQSLEKRGECFAMGHGLRSTKKATQFRAKCVSMEQRPQPLSPIHFPR